MSEATDDAITQIITVLRTVSGIDNIPLNPPSVKSYNTLGLVYPSNGEFMMGNPTGAKFALHNIAIDIITTEIDFARCMAKLKPLIDTVSMAFGRQVSFDSDGNPGQQFGDTIETFSSLSYSWIPSGTDYSGVIVTGLHFTMNNVKILVTL